MNSLFFFFIIYILIPVVSLADAPEAWQLGFQDARNTSLCKGLLICITIYFFFMIVVAVFVLWMLTRTLYHFHQSKNPIPEKIIHGTTIEIAMDSYS